MSNAAPTQPKPLSRPARGRRAVWKLADLLDYEVLLQKYTEADAPEAELRDEILGVAAADGVSMRRTDIAANRRWWLLEYVQAWQRRLAAQAEHSPGAITETALSGLGFVLQAVGALVGMGVVGTLFAQAGHLPDGSPMPVNVFWVLTVCLLPQVILALMATFGMLAVSLHWRLRPNAFLRFVAALVAPLGGRLAQLLVQQAGDGLRARVKSAVGLVLGRGQLHRATLTWPLIKLLQQATMTLGLGLAIGMLALPQVRHVTFGWQTTNPAITPELVHGVVKALAAPWSWLEKGGGEPTVADVAGSRIDVNRGAGSLDPNALTSWWPFLCKAFIVYGILPRIVLFLYSSISQRRALARESFDDSRSELLLGEIARWGELSAAPAPAREGVTASPIPDIAAPESGAFPCLVVLPPELDSPETRERLSALLASRLGWRILEFRAVYTVPEQEALISRLREMDWTGSAPRVLFVQRWNAAIVQDTKALVRSIMAAIGKSGHVIFALGGKVRLLEDPVTRPQTQYWREYANELKTVFPNVEVLPLGEK